MAALILWVILGGLVGGFVKSIAWYEGDRGWLACVLFGVAGGVAGGYLRALTGASSGFDLSSMGACILGAAAMLTAYQLATRRGSKAAPAGQERRAA